MHAYSLLYTQTLKCVFDKYGKCIVQGRAIELALNNEAS